MAKNKNISKVANDWQIATNPLRFVTKTQIDQMLNNARCGNDIRLQIAFAEVERSTPIYGICIQKRLAGIVNRKWDIVPIDDSEEAGLQAERIKDVFRQSDMKNMEGLTEAIRHLGLYSFRGRSAIKPFIKDGELTFRKLNNWNILERNDRVYWCPDGLFHSFDDLEEVKNTEIAWVKEELPIDIPGIQIYLRQLVGEEQWARFVEKQGIPQVTITAPEGTPDTELDKWANRAVQIFEGGSGVLPFNTKLDVLDSARGQDPFTSYIQHQMEMIAILATGGTLSTIGGSTGLGSNLADVQNSQFQSLITQDCKKISNAITQCVVRKCVREILKTDNVLCRFDFVENDQFTAKEYIDMAIQLHSMGMPISASKLKELTKIDMFADDVGDVWSPIDNNSNSNSNSNSNINDMKM